MKKKLDFTFTFFFDLLFVVIVVLAKTFTQNTNLIVRNLIGTFKILFNQTSKIKENSKYILKFTSKREKATVRGKENKLMNYFFRKFIWIDISQRTESSHDYDFDLSCLAFAQHWKKLFYSLNLDKIYFWSPYSIFTFTADNLNNAIKFLSDLHFEIKWSKSIQKT
ncbi:hypothetical protein BpHYR1_035732 [Brachionus plicatilis]|uniref:Uncharacterized protein n=1 Tax=Brachionus plicatilis TaxID=10195 RepID=A0A3M7SYX7_BRAPC|nr:hypothetical protein BpHYR1_035732 [Brachionus plicatilis]